jgi:hypothetical protein
MHGRPLRISGDLSMRVPISTMVIMLRFCQLLI